MKRALAARGALQSGELPYGLDQADTAKATAEYDLVQEVSNAAGQAINNYRGTESAVRTAQEQAMRDAEMSVYSNPLNRPTQGTEAQLDPDWKNKYGMPVYVGPGGELYTLGPDGNPVAYTPPRPAQPPPAGVFTGDVQTGWWYG
jgi:hypothetical protein